MDCENNSTVGWGGCLMQEREVADMTRGLRTDNPGVSEMKILMHIKPLTSPSSLLELVRGIVLMPRERQ